MSIGAFNNWIISSTSHFKEFLNKVKEVDWKLQGIHGEGKNVDSEKEKLKRLLIDIKTKQIDTQDKNQMDMQMIKAILSDIDTLNVKTDLCIEDIEKLKLKLEGLMAEWQKFVEENEERNWML